MRHVNCGPRVEAERDGKEKAETRVIQHAQIGKRIADVISARDMKSAEAE